MKYSLNQNKICNLVFIIVYNSFYSTQIKCNTNTSKITPKLYSNNQLSWLSYSFQNLKYYFYYEFKLLRSTREPYKLFRKRKIKSINGISDKVLCEFTPLMTEYGFDLLQFLELNINLRPIWILNMWQEKNAMSTFVKVNRFKLINNLYEKCRCFSLEINHKRNSFQSKLKTILDPKKLQYKRITINYWFIELFDDTWWLGWQFSLDLNMNEEPFKLPNVNDSHQNGCGVIEDSVFTHFIRIYFYKIHRFY